MELSKPSIVKHQRLGILVAKTHDRSHDDYVVPAIVPSDGLALECRRTPLQEIWWRHYSTIRPHSSLGYAAGTACHLASCRKLDLLSTTVSQYQ